MRIWLLVAGPLLGNAVGADPMLYAESDFAGLEKVDSHVHLYGALPEFMQRASTDNFRLLTINVRYRDFPPLQQQFDDARVLQREYPNRIAFAATFDASGSERTGWLERTECQLVAALDQGAVAVKVWKDIGMQQRDPDGRVVMIDDARFAPIFDLLETRHVPLLGHQGEPRNAWLPLEQMTVRGDREYFADHPQYHMFLHPEWPSHEQQIGARDRMLHSHPGLQFVGVHLASLEWDVERIADFLKHYPSASVDLAARLVHLQLQASVDRDKVRGLFIDFQDRILYGTDITRERGQSDAELAEEAHAAWFADWRFLSGDAPLHSTDFDAPFQGLALPRAVLDKIYRDNARRLFPRAWQGTAMPDARQSPCAPLETTEP
jgi:predicted TIM-barrel fold metal-dependent hydrolase